MTLRTTFTALALCGALGCGLAGCTDEHFTTELKAAVFNADSDSYTDTNKVWLTLQLKL